jgi:type IX secretion system PorP/SprF family membrane protein
MMKFKNIGPAIFSILCLTGAVSAQDTHFSMFSETPSSINPALAGVTYETRVVANYKTQWSSVASKYETMAVSFDKTIKHKKLKGNYFAISANIYKDVAGDAKMGMLNPNLGIAYLQKISKKMKLSGGLQSGFFYRTLDASNLHWDGNYNGYTYDPTRPSGEPNPPRSGFSAFDLGGGVNLNYVQSDKYIGTRTSARFDAGLSAYHYSLGKNSFLNTDEKLKTRVCAYFNGDFTIPNSINAIMPSVLYMRQGPSSEIVAGALFKFILGDPSTYTSIKKSRSLAIGGYYRFRDAIIPTLMFQYNTYAFGFAYDINVSALTPASKRNGGLEVMLRYNIFSGYGVNLGRTDTKPSY